MNEIKLGKAPGMDEFPAECLKKDCPAVSEWLMRLFNVSSHMGVVPMDWMGVVYSALYKGKDDKYEWSNSREVLIC